MRQGQLYINGQLCPRQPEGDYVADDGGIHMVLRLYQETLPNGVKHDILKATDEGEREQHAGIPGARPTTCSRWATIATIPLTAAS